jgi:hypothetical protein
MEVASFLAMSINSPNVDSECPILDPMIKKGEPIENQFLN